MKIKTLLLTVAVTATIFTGCAQGQKPAEKAPKQETKTETKEQPKTDVVTTASIVKDQAAFEKAISKNGTWIIAILNDLTFDKDLVVEGEFKNTKNPPVLQRKIALYTQDDKRNVTNRFTLTAPRLTFNSPAGSIEHGTFKGDLYIAGKNFKLIDATIDGNVYFLNEDAQSTFTMDDKSKITGVKELKK